MGLQISHFVQRRLPFIQTAGCSNPLKEVYHRRVRAALIPFIVCVAAAQSPIRVPVRLVSVPTLVLSPQSRVVNGLAAKDFVVRDNGFVQKVQLQTDGAPPSIVIAIQSNAAVTDYVSFVRKTGTLIESLLLGEGGRAAVLSYADNVKVIEPFGTNDLPGAMRNVNTQGTGSRMVDAGMKAVNLLKNEDRTRPRFLLFIGQSEDSGSEAKLPDLEKSAEAESVTIHCLTLPVMGQRFVADTFSLRGKPEDRGGFVASADLTKLVPAMRKVKRRASAEDPFSVLASATGGTQIHFRKQTQLENGLIAMGTAIRSSYLLTYPPSSTDAGYHKIAVSVDIPGDQVYSRPGYWSSGE